MKLHPTKRAINHTLWRFLAACLCIGLLFVMQNLKSSSNEHIARIGRSLLDDDGNSTCVSPSSQPDPCQYVMDNCGDVASFINYLEIHYCMLGHVPGLSFTLMALWLVLLFYLLGHTAQDYFCPTLARIADILRLSHNVAGVTFLAFGNGAPDIFSSFAALNSDNPGIAFGALFGAGVFVTTVVVGASSMAAPGAKLTRRPFLRDVLFYLIVVCLFVGIMKDEHVYAWEAGSCIGLYVVYVIVVIVSRIIYQRSKRRLPVTTDDADQEIDADTMLQSPHESPLDEPMHTDSVLDFIDDRSAVREIIKTGGAAYADARDREDYDTVATRGETQPLLINEDPVETAADSHLLSQSSSKPSKVSGLLATLREWTEWDEKNIGEKIMYVIFLPAAMVVRLSIPAVDTENYNRLFAVLNPVCSGLFLLLTINQVTTPVGPAALPAWALVLILGAAVGALVFFTTRQPGPPKYYVAYVPIAFVLSVAWVYVVANELVSLLQSLGIIINITPTLLALTILAWGNSVGDLVSDVTVAKQGFAGMGIGACYGVHFNLLMGVGISLLYWTLRYGRPYVFQFTANVGITMVALGISLVSSVLIVPLNKFHLSRWHGICLFVLYATFFTISLLYEFNVIHL